MTPEAATLKLFEAAQSGNVNDVHAALNAGADVNAKDKLQQTPLHRAALSGRIDVARLLIENGANPNTKDYRQRTPLRLVRLAGPHDTTDIVKLLEEAEKKSEQKPGQCADGNNYTSRVAEEREADGDKEVGR
jgi:ankyrin repeat protein